MTARPSHLKPWVRRWHVVAIAWACAPIVFWGYLRQALRWTGDEVREEIAHWSPEPLTNTPPPAPPALPEKKARKPPAGPVEQQRTPGRGVRHPASLDPTCVSEAGHGQG